MAVTLSTREFAPFGKCIVLSNGDIEAVVTVDIGPRIISLSAFGGDNMFFADTEGKAVTVDPRIKEAFGNDTYYFYGGQRLWWTPERIPETYAPEDTPVEWKETENGAAFTRKHLTGLTYTTQIKLADSGAHIDIFHTIVNESGVAVKLAPWSITQCAVGGIAVAPQNTRQCAPLPNRLIVHWPYNDMYDNRFTTAPRYISLRQDVNMANAFKFGMNNEAGWCAYLLKGQLLRKTFGFDPEAEYEDYGCNCESYTNNNFLEIEALGPVVTVADGEDVKFDEMLDVIPFEGDIPDAKTEAFADFIDSIIG